MTLWLNIFAELQIFKSSLDCKSGGPLYLGCCLLFVFLYAILRQSVGRWDGRSVGGFVDWSSGIFGDLGGMVDLPDTMVDLSDILVDLATT